MSSLERIVLATHNKDKTAEFREIFSGLDIEVSSLDSYPMVGEIEEDGETLEENALKKAREVFRVTGVPALADDTGLEVFYLDKAPGVYSARYAGVGATYRENVEKLLNDMRGVPFRRRGPNSAAFSRLRDGRTSNWWRTGYVRGKSSKNHGEPTGSAMIRSSSRWG